MIGASVIIAVYNTEQYLCKCLNSVYGQIFKDFELILVNDGSADKSGDNINEFLNQSLQLA